MLRNILVLVVVALVSRPAFGAEGSATKKPAPATAWTAQPTEIPGKWKLVNQSFPPMGEILKRPAAELPVYGLYAWCGEYKEHRDSIKKVGWKSVRIGGPMDDQTMKMLCRDGMEVMKTLGLRDLGGGAGDKKNRADYDADEPFIADYVAGIEKFLTRYGPGGTFFKENPGLPKLPIMHVEIWNEPNFQYMIPDREPRAEVEAEREALYAKVLPAAHKAIKARWPTVTVVGFGAGGSSSGDLRFIKHVHGNSPAVARSYDILSTHPYMAPVAPEAHFIKPWGGYAVGPNLAKLRKTLAEHGRGSAPIWYTEVGWPISQAEGGHFKTDPKRTYVSPVLQAAYVCRMYALAMRLGVQRVHIMFATDTDNFNGGFFLRDKSWRPSAYAVQNMIRLLPRPKLTKVISDGKDGFYTYSFMADTWALRRRILPPVVMAWNVGGPKTVEIPFPWTKVTVTDMLGNNKKVVAKDGKVSVEVGPCPIYIIAR
ncbi:MAG: hypothetical protein GWP05_04650 [Anaerolineaceae bacterium]|nr:hypothetical protein [Anaerolineaceae bacterium]